MNYLEENRIAARHIEADFPKVRAKILLLPLSSGKFFGMEHDHTCSFSC